MKDLSVLIPARNEMFLARTIQDILENVEADTEVIATLDGEWADPGVPQHDRVNIIYVPEPIGQRAATNIACKLAQGKYVMKVDAHCSFDKGFDRKMLEAYDVLDSEGSSVTMVPIMRNLWAYDWKCIAKGTNIVTPTGLKPIEEIHPSEDIISGDGLPHKVKAKVISKPSSSLVQIQPYKMPPLIVTKDHLVKVYPYKHVKTTIPNSHKLEISETPKWVKAGELKNGKYKMVFPFPTEENPSSIDSLTDKKRLARLLGYFVSEGCYAHKGGQNGHFKLLFVLHKDETHIADEIEQTVKTNFVNRFNKPATTGRYPSLRGKSVEIKVYSQQAVGFVKQFVIGDHALTKRFVPEVITWPRDLQRELLDALVTGDGTVHGKGFSYFTTSKQLAFQVYIIALRLGYLPSMGKRNNVGGNFKSNGPLYSITVHNATGGKWQVSSIRNGEYLVTVRKVEETQYHGLVYDLSIEGLPEILTESGVVHNCYYCGWKKYQGPTPERCGNQSCGKTGRIRRKMMWKGKERPQSWSYCFDSSPHFQYFEEYKKRPEIREARAKTGFTETMSLQGSCFMATREKYRELNLCDESFGSWGNQGIEVALKTWLSGGRVLVYHNTWYAHMFRTQGGDFGFPYEQRGREVQKTKQKTWQFFLDGKWDKQVHPVSWLVERFWPVKGWTQEALDRLRAQCHVDFHVRS